MNGTAKSSIDYQLRTGKLLTVFGCFLIVGLLFTGSCQYYIDPAAQICYTDTTDPKASTYMLYGKVYTDTNYNYEKKCFVNK